MSNARPLTRQRIIEAAVAVADDAGLAGVSMRSVGRRLGVEAMSLYHHIGGKEQLLDELADWVFAHYRAPGPDAGWREGIRDRTNSVRETLTAHPWGLMLVDSRTAGGPGTYVHYDAMLGCLRRSGFSIEEAGHLYSVIDSYVYGFVLTEQKLPLAPGGLEDFVSELSTPLDGFPYMLEFATAKIAGGSYAYASEFDIGLELLLDAFEGRLSATAPTED